MMVSLATWLMEARASPRKPNVEMVDWRRSYFFRNPIHLLIKARLRVTFLKKLYHYFIW